MATTSPQSPTLLTILLLITLILSISTITINADYKLSDYSLSNVDGTLAAIGDFNSDKQADLFVVSFDDTAQQYYVKIYLWNDDNDERYKLLASANPISSVEPIYSVIVGDFNYDGRLDVLITGPKTVSTTEFSITQTTADHGEYYARVFFGNAKEIISTTPFEITPSPVGQVSSMSLTGALLPDLYGMHYNADTSQYERGLWSFIPTVPGGSVPIDPTQSFELTFTSLPRVTSIHNPLLNTLSFPYLATGFAPVLGDFDGDCAADLIIVSTKTAPDQQIYPGLDLNGSVPYDPSVIQYDPEKQIEIWIFDRSASIDSRFPYTLHSTLPAQLGLLQPSIGDFNKDGALDLALPYCYPYATCADKTGIEIHYNSQKGMCSTLSLSSSCRSTTSLCVSDPKWSIDYPGKQLDKAPEANVSEMSAQIFNLLDDSDDGDDGDDDDEDHGQPAYYNGYKITSTTPKAFDLGNNQVISFALPHLGKPLSLLNPPFRLTITDINLDSDLDFVFTAKIVGTASNKSSSVQTVTPLQTSSTTSFIAAITTVECQDDNCSKSYKDDKLYVFDKLSLPNLRSVTKDHYIANFGTIDFGNSGSMDIIIIRYDSGFDPYPSPDAVQDENQSMRMLQTTPSTFSKLLMTTKLVGLENAFYDDVYFLTLLGGNGMCHSWCNGLEFPSPKPYGVNQSGLVFKFTVTALSGDKSPRIFIQQPQTAYSPLLPPYQVVGLGRTSNYIEELFLGIPTTIAATNADNSQLFQAMIPNSQIYVFPYPITDPLSWRIELFISPAQRLLAVFIAFVVTTAACCLVILILHLREKWAEEKLKKQRQRLFAF